MRLCASSLVATATGAEKSATCRETSSKRGAAEGVEDGDICMPPQQFPAGGAESLDACP